MDKKLRKAIIAGNWKMNMLASGVKTYSEALNNAMPKEPSCEIVLCVPSPLIPALADAARASRINSGAQDLSEHESGAYTGDVSAAMLRDLGVKYVIIGHSERRAYHGEADLTVNAKVTSALAGGLIPVICVGETDEQREKGLTETLVAFQVKAALCGVSADALKGCVIAYEPVWAIGTGKTATAEEAGRMCGFIRDLIKKDFGEKVSNAVSILYGGSMNAKNAAELLARPDIDGGLIGGASLKPEDFALIITAAG
ncbi:MAG: triose-phosphate isomerase [Oscillospiraceae bacterium]|nr:triose-phosphate isomerase [Oscillospiraceae bacterium]